MTFEHQDTLLKLGLPELTEIRDKFIATLSPVLTEEEKIKTIECVDSYFSETGAKTYKELEKYNENVENYLHQFWEDTYLKDKSSLVLNINPIFIFEDDPTSARNNQVARAASLLFSTFKFISAVKNETLAPDIWRKSPLCMIQFKQLFGTTRIPQKTKDIVKTFENSKHIVVLCRGKFYTFSVLDSNNNAYLTQREIVKNLERILNDDIEIESEEIGIFTTLERNQWAEVRSKLEKSSAENLEIIDSALLIVCLDQFETDVNKPEQIVCSALCGKVGEKQVASNRWYDKLQLIISKNGQASVNFEHSVVDGHTVLRYVSDVFTDTIIRFAKTISGTRVDHFLNADSIDSEKADFSRRQARQVKRLTFQLNRLLKKRLVYARETIEDVVSTIKVSTLEYTSYGKKFITSFKMSPDAFVQISILAAYYSLYGKVDNTYESVLTKTFKLGRTEVGRSVSFECIEYLVKFFEGDEETQIEKLEVAQIEDLVKLLKVALRKHSTTIKNAAKGDGIDRILFALKQTELMNHGEAHPFFSSVGYKKLCHNVISTSNCGNPSLRFFGFGPVVKEGLGIGYVIKDESINYCVSSYEKRPKRFVDKIESYLNRIHDLIVLLEPKDFEVETDKIIVQRQNSNVYDFYGETG